MYKPFSRSLCCALSQLASFGHEVHEDREDASQRKQRQSVHLVWEEEGRGEEEKEEQQPQRHPVTPFSQLTAHNLPPSPVCLLTD